jgi:hypothetical protein
LAQSEYLIKCLSSQSSSILETLRIKILGPSAIIITHPLEMDARYRLFISIEAP